MLSRDTLRNYAKTNLLLHILFLLIAVDMIEAFVFHFYKFVILLFTAAQIFIPKHTKLLIEHFVPYLPKQCSQKPKTNFKNTKM